MLRLFSFNAPKIDFIVLKFDFNARKFDINVPKFDFNALLFSFIAPKIDFNAVSITVVFTFKERYYKVTNNRANTVNTRLTKNVKQLKINEEKCNLF
jgi:hypothetical protein